MQDDYDGAIYHVQEVDDSFEGAIYHVKYVDGGPGDQHNLGYYATQAALEEAHPTAEAGDWAIVGTTDTVWIWDTDNSAWVDSDQKGQVTSVNGQTGAVVLSIPDAVQYSTMPTASSSNVGDIVQFIGTTDANYTNGYFYKCAGTTTPSSATATQTVGSSLSDIAVVVATFETQVSSSGTYVYTYTNSNWENAGEIVDFTDYGITYTGTPVEGDQIDIVYTEASASYAWIRIDVQPAPEALPSQTGQSGKFLTTDGTDASWSDKPLVNTATGNDSLTILGTSTTTYSSVNIGVSASAPGALGTSIGWNAHAEGLQSVAVGSSSNAKNKLSIAIGSNASATGIGAIGIGGGAVAASAIQIGSGSNNTANTLCVGSFYNSTAYHWKLLDLTSGTIPTDRLTNAINKYSSMPTASADYLGQIVQFTGTTDATYTHGYIYECVSDGQTPATYSWTAVSVQAGGSSLPSQTGNAGKFLKTDGTDVSWGDALVNKANFSTSASTVINMNGTVPTNFNNVIIGGAITYTSSAQGVVSLSSSYDGSKPVGSYGISIIGLAMGLRSCAIGAVAKAYTKDSIAIGTDTSATGESAIAIGKNCATNANGAIQIGSSSTLQTNSDANTFKVANANGNFEMMSANGTVPTARLTKVNSTITLTAAGWSSNTQTVNVTGMTATGVVFVSPDPTDQADYTSAGILCTAQAAGTLTFTCDTVPSGDIDVNVVML